MLVEAGHLQAANAKLANTKYEQIKNLNNRMITHHNTSKRLEFYELQDLITELSQWLNSQEHMKKMTLIYLNPKNLMETQMALIDLGLNILEYCDYVQDSLREKYYGLLTKILKRDELEKSQLEVTKEV